MTRAPEHRRALVLDAQSSAGIETVQALGRAGVAVDVASESSECLAFRSRYATARLAQPGAEDIAPFVAWLREQDARRQYTLIVCSTENSLLALDSLAADDPLRIKALLPPSEALEVALSKEATRARAAALGLRVPSSRLIESSDAVPEPSGFPVVLKPVRSLVRVGENVERLVPAIVRDAGARRSTLARMLRKTSVQEQEYVSGRGLGVECLYEHGRLSWYFVHERIHEVPLTGGGSSYRKSVAPNAGVIRFARKLLDDLRWHGVAMVEFKLEPDGNVCLMEINPRLWGSLALALDAGVNFPLGMWRLACGSSPGAQPEYRVPYYTRHITRDFDWLKENWKADPTDRLLLTQPRFRSLLEYLRPLTFRESWDHFSFADPRICFHQVYTIVRSGMLGAVKRALQRRLLRRRFRARVRELTDGVKSGDRVIRNVMFVCYGNICRSPFAEVYARKHMPAITATSVALHGAANRASPEHLVSAAHALGIDLGSWRSQRVEAAGVEHADLICTMDTKNYDAMLEQFPQCETRTLPLGIFDPEGQVEIEDPYSMGEEGALAVLTQMRRALDGLARVLSEAPSQPK